MPSKLIDCGKKAVSAKLLTQEEVDFVARKAKDLGETMSRADADLAAARSMVQDGINELQNIRHQLGKADPIKEAKILYRTTNKEAALAAMMDETQAVVETKVLEETRKLQGDEGKMMAAQQAAEEKLLGPVFHGTTKDFEDFDTETPGQSKDSGYLGTGAYFTIKPDVAGYYAGHDQPGANVRKVLLSLKNPFMWGPKTQGVRGLFMRGERLPAEIHDTVIEKTGFVFDPKIDPYNSPFDEKDLSRAVREVLIEKGYDGVIATDAKGNPVEFVAFYPEQIRNAIGRGAKPRAVDREAEITAAVERLNKNPTERVEVYQKARDRMLALMKEHKIEIAGMEFERGMTPEERAVAGITRKPPAQHEIQKEKLLAAMGELNALLKFLPAEVRGKVGGFFQLAQGGVGETELADFFAQRIKMVEREMERLLKRDYLGEIKKLLQKSKPVAGANKIKKSKIGDAQEAADIASRAAEMTADETAAEMDALESALTNPDLTPEEHSQKLYEYNITALFGDLAHANAETLAAAHAWLSDTVARGRSEWGAKEEARLEQVRGFSGGIVEGLPAVTQAGISAMARPPSALTWLNSFGLEHYSFAQFMQHVLPDGATVVKRWQDWARRADNSTQDAIRKAGDRLTEHMKSALATTDRLTMGRAIKLLKQEERMTKAGESIPITRLQAIQYILSWNQPDVREKMINQKWTQAEIDQMVRLTSDEASQAAMDFAREEYARGYSIVNPVYKRMNGMNMPQVQNYAPTRYHSSGSQQELSLFGGPMSTSGVTPSFQIGRVKHNATIRQEDALTVFWQHITQQAHWVNHAELIREMRGVLGNPEVKKAIQQKYGAYVAQDVNKWIDALARQGGNRAAELGTVNDLLSTLIGGKAVSSLGLNLKTIFMQIDSAGRAVLALPFKRIVKAMTDPKFIETLPIAWHSDAIQRRVQGGGSPEARYLFDQTRTSPSMFLRLGRAAMLPLQYADGYFTSFSSAIVFRDAYNEALETGLDEAQATAFATDKMDESVYRYSQPTGLASKSLQEVTGNNFFKLLMMFLSDARLKSAMLQESVRGIAKNPLDATSWRKFAAVESFAIISWLVGNMYRDAFTDDEDDEIWTPEGFALALATAPLAGYLLAGTAAELAIKGIMGEQVWAPSRDPLSDAAFKVKPAITHFDDLWNTDDTKAMMTEWNNLARVIAVGGPGAASLAVIVNLLKPIQGAIENEEKEE